MKNIIYKQMTLFLISLLLLGCQTVPVEDLRPNYGNAVLTNAELQTLNPDAGQRSSDATTLYGAKGERVIRGYLEGPTEASKEALIKDIGGDN